MAFVLSSILLKSPEFSMFIAAAAGVLTGMIMKVGDLDIVRAITVLIEGLFTNFDLAIQFICASIFVNVYSNSGSLNFLTRKIVKLDNKWIIMVFMAIFMMIPGALTGAGSVSIFVMGALVATVLKYMGLNEKKTTAFVFMFAILSAACPPINLWTMMMTAQANMPYVGFSKLLLFPIIIVSVFSIIYLGWGAKKESKERILAELPEDPEGMNWFRVILPFAVLLGLFLLSLYKPFDIPVLGVPLMFVISTVVAILCNPQKIGAKAYGKLINDTFEQVFSLVATVISVGALVNTLAATGVKGLIGITFITMPIVLMYILLLIVGPFAQGCMSYGSAILIATPLIFMMNTRGMDTTIVAAALSVIFPIGDCLPPSRIVGRVAIETTGFKGTYTQFLKSILLPCALLGIIGLVMFINPSMFKWLK
ncbi:MAG: hypothetical protein KBS81_08930 [Spirochaetales bacterium]|nr:hypothetical protein [Candidatus Physcosoma equi]